MEVMEMLKDFVLEVNGAMGRIQEGKITDMYKKALQSSTEIDGVVRVYRIANSIMTEGNQYLVYLRSYDNGVRFDEDIESELITF